MKSILVLWQVSARARIWNGDELVDDPSSSGVSDADRSALATALALAEPETIITVLSVGGAAAQTCFVRRPLTAPIELFTLQHHTTI